MTKVYRVYKTEKRCPKFRERLYTESYQQNGKEHVSTQTNVPAWNPIFADRWVLK